MLNVHATNRMTTINLIANNLNRIIETTGSAINFMSKSTSNTQQASITLSSNAINNKNYSLLQIKLFIFVIFYWLSLFIVLNHISKISKVKHFLYESIINQLTRLKTSRLVIGILLKIQNRIQVFDIWKISNFIHRFKHTINRINNFKGEFIKSIKSALYILPKILQSISAITSTFSFNIKRVILMPSRIKKAYLAVANEIAKFWRTIEQIIQIIRLPIEILSLIGRFLSSVVTFLKRLEKPRKPKLI